MEPIPHRVSPHSSLAGVSLIPAPPLSDSRVHLLSAKFARKEVRGMSGHGSGSPAQPCQRAASAGRSAGSSWAPLGLLLGSAPQPGGLSSCLPRLPPSFFILCLWLGFPLGKSRLQPLLRRNSLLVTGALH